MRKIKTIFLKYFVLTLSAIFFLVVLYPIYANNLTLENYLKDYSALILIFLTYVYVLLTYMILNSSKKLSQEQMRPYVVANFIEENNDVYFSIINYGKRPAFNTQINISDGFEELQPESIRGNYKYLLNQKFLAPSQEIKNYVSNPMYVLSPRKKDASKCFDISISFLDSDRKNYELKYQIDFNNLYDEKSIKKVSITDNLDGIKKEIKSQNELLKKYFEKRV